MKGSEVKTLVVQIQPSRVASFSDTTVADLLTIKAPPGLIMKSGKEEQVEPSRFVNVTFETGEIDALWPLVRERLQALGLLGGAIVVCTGNGGWNDYLQLHHYDAAETSDTVTAD